MLSFPADFPFSKPEKNQGFQGRLDSQIYRLQVAARRAFQVGQAFHRLAEKCTETASMDWLKGKFTGTPHILIYFNMF
jgi:hypothetical protein